jgi:hypothetical protein
MTTHPTPAEGALTDERKAFEAWAKAQHLIGRGGRVSPSGEIAWAAWQERAVLATAQAPAPAAAEPRYSQARRAVGKWLNECPQNAPDLRDIAELCADFDRLAAQAPAAAEPVREALAELASQVRQAQAGFERYAGSASVNAAMNAAERALAATQPSPQEPDMRAICEALAGMRCEAGNWVVLPDGTKVPGPFDYTSEKAQQEPAQADTPNQPHTR